MESFLDNDEAAVDLFKELGGLIEIAKRVTAEIDLIEKSESSKGKEEMTDVSTTSEGILESNITYLSSYCC